LIPVGGKDFSLRPNPSTPGLRLTQPLPNDTRVLLGGKGSECHVDHPSPFSAEVKERVQLYLYSIIVPSWQLIRKMFNFNYNPEHYN
jgi:hypothetical protein